ncbi:MAG: carbon-nitrogen hydrolase family protein [Oscillospiraceae bacterium]|nr:carbon-nitrogen hydrolase family protein [Oscillospiraceae bacterium]
MINKRMRIFALELNNDIKGIEVRKQYIENLISQLPSPDLVVLPELAVCSYMACQDMWRYADECGQDTSDWAVRMAKKYNTYIGAGYLDREDGDYYNRYMIAGPDGVCGTVTKSEGESAVFKRGDFGSVIDTPFGKVGVAICFDSRRKHFYENVKDEELSLILFPHGAPADPKKLDTEHKENDTRCMMYVNTFGVPVVYVNCRGELEYMPGMMGAMMAKAGFRMNGMSRIYSHDMANIPTDIPEAVGAETEISPKRRTDEIKFHGEDILPGNWLFKNLILRPDTAAGIRSYEKNKVNPVRTYVQNSK